MKIAIISPYNIKDLIKSEGKNTRPVPWTLTLANGLSKIENTEVHIITGVSPRIKNIDKNDLSENINFHLFKTCGRFSSILFYLYEVLQIRKILKEIDPHIVHGQGVESHSGLAAILSGYPNFITIHGVLNEIYKTSKRNRFLRKQLELIAMYLAKNVVVINPYIHSIFKKYIKSKYQEKKYFNIANPVSIEFFKNIVKSTNDDKVKILYCGAFRKRKGLFDLLTVLKEISKDVKNFKLFISGILGPDEESKLFFESVKKFCRSHLNEYTQILGYVPSNEMPAIMSKMDFVVLPSKFETAPMVISESMASSLPVIAYDVGGIKHMIKNNKTGFVVPVNDMKSLGNKILTLIKNKKLRKEMGIIANEIAQNEYHPELIVRKTLLAYEEVIAE